MTAAAAFQELSQFQEKPMRRQNASLSQFRSFSPDFFILVIFSGDSSDALGAILVTCNQQLAKLTAVTMAIEYIGKNDKVSWSGHPFSNISVTTSNPRKGRI